MNEKIELVDGKFTAKSEQEEDENDPNNGEGDNEGVVVEERTEAEQINELLDKNYTVKQIRDEFGFNRDTIRQQVKKRVPPDIETKDETRLPVIMKKAEMVTPERMMQDYLVKDGDEGQAMFKGMMLLRAAQRMVMDDVEIMRGLAEADATKLRPILKLMEETRKEQDSAAERAKSSNEGIAARAAAGVVEGISPVFESLKSAITTSGDNPMLGMMAGIMQPIVKGVFSRFIPGVEGEQAPTAPKGFTRKGGQEE